MHTQERSIENHDTRRTTTEEILSRLCPDTHDEHDWNTAVHDFVHTNFAEIEARVIANHLGSNNKINFESIEKGRTATMRKAAEPKFNLGTTNSDNFDALADGHEGTMVL